MTAAQAIAIAALTIAAGVSQAAVETSAPTPTATTVAGTAFGETFKAGYAYAKRDPQEGTVFVFFGNGKSGGCDVQSTNETAFVGMNHPAKKGTYTTAPSEAYFSKESLEPRAFTSFKIDVKEVTEKSVRGSLEMASASGSTKGTIAGEFNAAICPGTN